MNDKDAIAIEIDGGTDAYTVGFIQQIERKLDEALVPLGFKRIRTDKEPRVIRYGYYQFARAHG